MYLILLLLQFLKGAGIFIIIASILGIIITYRYSKNIDDFIFFIFGIACGIVLSLFGVVSVMHLNI